MNTSDKAFDAAIDDLRALMDAAIANDWQEMHIVEGDTEIFIAREGGVGNPLLGMTSDGAEGQSPTGAVHDLIAPHVATVSAIAVVPGDWVEEGAEIATLSVLDEPVSVVAPCAGIVVDVGAALGELVEFDTVIMRIAEGGR